MQLYCRSPATGGGKKQMERPSFFLSFILPFFLPSLPPSPQRKSSQKNAGGGWRLGGGGAGGWDKSLPFRQSLSCALWFSVDGWVARLWVTVPNMCGPVPCVCGWACMRICMRCLFPSRGTSLSGCMVLGFEKYACPSLLANAHSCCDVCIWFPILCVSVKPLVPVRPSPSGDLVLGGRYIRVWHVCTQLSIATRPVSEVCILALG